jgi:uncharacterized repeat protein (TIGR01451 family)
MVVQRSNNNTASVQIAGSYSVQLDTVEARFVSLQGGQTTSWAILQANPTNGQFNGTLTAQGGWYRIEVRGKLAGQVVGSSLLAHFGVGEVFAIFGHSNAQGSSCNGNDDCASIPGATDERVVSIPLTAYEQTPAFGQYLNTADPAFLPGLTYGTMSSGVGASPFHGSVSWTWGRTGDLLVQQLGVPVLFYGAGFGGTNMQQAWWAINNQYFEHGFCRWDLQMPYANLRNLMNLYVPTTGLRGILMIHGENDRVYSQETIRFNNREFIKAFRQKLGREQLSWVIAISSYVGQRFDHIRNAQFQAINDLNTDPAQTKVFTGPDLDPPAGTTGPFNYRPDGLHYSPAGQLHYAQLWADNLTANNNAFFQTSTPVVAETQPLASISCANATELHLKLPDTFNTYAWNTGSTSQEVQVGSGYYAARVQRSSMANPNARDAIRVYFPPAVAVPDGQKIPNTPTITASGLVSCGTAVTLTSSATGRSVWSTGAVAPAISVSGPGTYSVGAKHPAYECASANSSNVVIAAGSADLSVGLVASKRTVAVGETNTLTLTVRNDGPCDVSGVQLENHLPENIALVTAEAGLTNAGTLLRGELPLLVSGGQLSQSFTVKAVAPGTYRDAFQLKSSPLPDPDSQPGSGTGDGQDDMAQVDFRTPEASTTVYASPNPNQTPLPPVQSNQPAPNPTKADLSLAFVASQRTARVGQPVSFSLTLRNIGGLEATNVQVRAILPNGLTFSTSASGMTATGAVVQGNVPSIGAGTSVTLVFTVTLGTAAGTSLPISAEISAADQPDPDSTPGNATLSRGEDDEARVEVRGGW